jgi:hypothetical protein
VPRTAALLITVALAGASMLSLTGSARPASTLLYGADFYTPGVAAACYGGGNDGQFVLHCWTPNDGFSLYLWPRRRAEKPRYDRALRGAWQVARDGYLLHFGSSWTNRSGDFRCWSRRTGLTCKNRVGHGWWLGRYRGYRIF